jgi:hypothetical protein
MKFADSRNCSWIAVLLAVFAFVAFSLPSVLAQTPTSQSQSQTSTPIAPPVQRPDGPLNTHTRAGVRGVGFPVVVRVQLNGLSVTGAHITIAGPDGADAGAGDTDSSGVLRLNLDAGDYVFTASSGDKKSTAKAHVESSLTLVVIELAPTTASPQ